MGVGWGLSTLDGKSKPAAPGKNAEISRKTPGSRFWMV